MKTFTTYALTATLLIGLTTSTFAQNERTGEMQRARMKAEMYSLWNDDGWHPTTVETFLFRPDVRAEIGISARQQQNIRDATRNTSYSTAEDPVIKAMHEEIAQFVREARGRIADAPEETQKRYRELLEQLPIKTVERMEATQKKNMTNAINEYLTPDQLLKIKAYQIHNMSNTSFLSPSMFEALDLSDAQRKQLGDIKKGMEPEYEKFVDRLIDARLKLSEKHQAEYAQFLDGVTDPAARANVFFDHRKEVVEKVNQAHPELQQKLDEITEFGKNFAERLKVEMFDVLTDEQWERMTDLIDNPPDYVALLTAQHRVARENNDNRPSERQPGFDAWTPGPNSWQPGDPIPEAYRQERNTRGTFPRPKQPSPTLSD